jgi:hypothetical protein
MSNTGVPYTVVDYSCYYENILGAMRPRKNEKGEFVLGKLIGLAISFVAIN